MLPNFLVIGAAKAGTSSIHRYLGAHPEIFMTRAKEVRFFVDKRFENGVEWYESHFADAGDALAIGETSPQYTTYPQREGVAERIARVIPEARLIYLVREPLARIRSLYLQRVDGDAEHETLEGALRNDPAYLDTTRYATQIEQYMPFFDREQLLVVLAEDLLDRRLTTMQRICTFLGVNPLLLDQETLELRANTAVGKREPRPTAVTLRRIPGYSLAKRATPRGLRDRARQGLRRRVRSERGALTDEARELIVSEINDEVIALRDFAGDRLDVWGEPWVGMQGSVPSDEHRT